MNTPRPLPVYALTGTIGSGKSTVANILEDSGSILLDADVLAREVVLPDSEGLRALRNQFGQSIILPDGTLDRKKLGSLVFSDPKARESLESILHPLIRQLYLSKLSKLQSEAQNGLHPQALSIVYVVPLLFESKNTYPEIDKTIVVAAPRELCIKRIMARDHCSSELAEQKLDSQLPIEEKIKRADYVVNNTGTTEELESEVHHLIRSLQSKGAS
ncbi:MAG: dephospho-CoA kinase [Bdellovibrionales bacterium]|nr:dephospho-CoA kinase [Bdellovibrionales bacterium]